MRFLSIFLVLAGCESKSGCTPGASIACTCIDGNSGAQSCRADGTFDVCVCMQPTQQNPIVDMGGTSNVVIHDLSMPASSGNGKRVFVTSTAYAGNAVLDACNIAAAAAGLGGTWSAWLSTQSGDALDAVTGGGPWKRLDGVLVFNNHANLATAPLAAINVDENRRQVNSLDHVWTGTDTGGRKSGYACLSWTSAGTSEYGSVGYVDQDPQSWTAGAYDNCNVSNHVYCLEN